MPRQNNSSKLVAALLKNENFPVKLRLIDVGASGGISAHWDQWRPRLHAVGFDPLLTEIETLNSAESDYPNIRYEAAWVGTSNQTSPPPPLNIVAEKVLDLSSAMHALRIKGMDYRSQFYNRGKSVEYSDAHTSIDEYCDKSDLPEVDFLKIDTDGQDLHVLRGASKSLTDRGILGVLVESMLHGSAGPDVSTFANIDNFMREKGFFLFDMDVNRYTRYALPGQFQYDMEAQTYGGQVRWCDALYFIDPVLLDLLGEPAPQLSTDRLLKLAALYDMFSLPDCAAQLLMWMRDKKIGPDKEEIGLLLDSLVPENPFDISRHDQYLALFLNDSNNFFPSRYKQSEILGKHSIPKPVDISLFSGASPLTVNHGNGIVTVRTPEGQWSDAAVLRIPPANGVITIKVDLEVLAGKIYVALANSDFKIIGQQVGVSQSAGKCSVFLEHNSFDVLLIRNGEIDGCSICNIYEVVRLFAV